MECGFYPNVLITSNMWVPETFLSFQKNISYEDETIVWVEVPVYHGDTQYFLFNIHYYQPVKQL